MGWHDLLAASRQAGGPIAIRGTAAAAGLSPRAVRARIRRECWWHPFPNVAAPPGLVPDASAWARAAVGQATGTSGDPNRDLAAIRGGSALALIGVQRHAPTRVEVVVPAGRRVARHPRLAVVRSRLVLPSDLVSLDGIPVLAGLPLLRDLARTRPVDLLRDEIIDLAKAGWVDLRELSGFLDRQLPFPGKATLWQVARQLLHVGRTDSPLELRLRDGLTDEGIPLDRGQVRVPSRDGRGWRDHDLGITRICFAIDGDGFGFHSSRADLDRDAARANELALVDEDWRVLRATWSMLAPDRWRGFVEQVRGVTAMQSRRHLGIPWPRPDDIAT